MFIYPICVFSATKGRTSLPITFLLSLKYGFQVPSFPIFSYFQLGATPHSILFPLPPMRCAISLIFPQPFFVLANHFLDSVTSRWRKSPCLLDFAMSTFLSRSLDKELPCSSPSQFSPFPPCCFFYRHLMIPESVCI